MKFALSCITALTALVATVSAQNVNIGYPKDGSTITPGQSLIVELDRPNTLTNSKEVAVVISLTSCPDRQCPSPAEKLGSTLYYGPYKPQYPPSGQLPVIPHQNFTVQVPDSLATGLAQLSVVHLSLAGSGPFPFYQLKNITLNVQ